MSKIKQTKIPVDFKQASLERVNDGLVKTSNDLKFIEWDSDGRAVKLHDSMEVGRSAILSPFNMSFTWQTTEITEILSDTEFKTKNSHYKIRYENK